MQPSARWVPRRPVLLPGTHVLRRGAGEVQVGLDPRHAVVLPDDPAVRALLARLATAGGPAVTDDPDDPDDAGNPGLGGQRETLAALHDGGLLLDADGLLPLIPAGPGAPPPAARSDVAALARSRGDEAGAVLRGRRAARIDVLAVGSPLAEQVAGQLVALLHGVGASASLQVATGARPTAVPAPPEGRGRGGRREGSRDVGALVAVGEPQREHVDCWMRAATPHVLLRLTEGYAAIGPFVLPGETPCLRCLDAHHTDHDPAWPLLVRQYASACARGRDDTVPEPVDALLATLAVAWVARDLVSFLDGHQPVTAATTIRLDPRLTCVETQGWSRHAGCGCSWS